MMWFRHWQGMATDPKLHRISRRLKTRRHLVVAAWCAVLEYACGDDSPGSVDGLDAATLAYMTDCSEARARALLRAFNEAGMIENGTVAKWSKRQFGSDSSTKRVQKFREKSSKSFQNDAKSPSNVQISNLQPIEKAQDTSTMERFPRARAFTESESDTESERKKPPIPPLQGGGCEPAFETEPDKPAPGRPKRYLPPELDELFARFCKAYPRASDERRAKTRVAFVGAAAICDAAELVDRARRYAEHCQRKGTDERYVTMAHNWLNNEEWRDHEPLKPPPVWCDVAFTSDWRAWMQEAGRDFWTEVMQPWWLLEPGAEAYRDKWTARGVDLEEVRALRAQEMRSRLTVAPATNGEGARHVG